MSSGSFAEQLERLGLSSDAPPDARSWSRFLGEMDRTWRAHEDERDRLMASLSVSSHRSERLTARLEETARREVAELEALRQVATEVASGASTESIAQLVAERVVEITGRRVGLVIRFGADQALVVGATGPGTSAGHRWRMDPRGPLSELRRTGQTAIGHAPDLRGVAVPWMAAPVMVGGEVWGAIMVLASGAGERTADHLASFAHLVGIAIDNAEQHRLLAEQAARDPLTGLYNHRIFHESLERSLAASRRDGRALSLILFDIDHFKRVNDTFGHGVGDAVLRELTGRLRTLVRGGDTIARVGGEEFGWVVSDSDGDEALAAAERLRLAVSETPFAVAGRQSVSVGICDRRQAASAEDLFAFADGALYWAKEHGRNRCILYSPEVVASLSAREEAERQRRAQALASVQALARAVDAKDSSTHRHSERVARNACRLAQRAGWSRGDIARLHEAGVLHDVGKIGIADGVLTKRGRLDDHEEAMVRRHPELGATIASGLLDDEQLAWIRGHHERWAGTGYPDGLAGEMIPAGARLLAVADALDAMLHDRSYRASMSVSGAVAEIRRTRGVQFAPEAVDLLDELIGADGICSLAEPELPAALAAA